MDNIYFEGDVKSFRPVLFALNNDIFSYHRLIEFLVGYGMKYEGEQNPDSSGFSREHLFTYGDFKLTIFWVRNASSIRINPAKGEGAFMDCRFDHIREANLGYSGYESLAFCLGDYEKIRLSIPCMKESRMKIKEAIVILENMKQNNEDSLELQDDIDIRQLHIDETIALSLAIDELKKSIREEE